MRSTALVLIPLLALALPAQGSVAETGMTPEQAMQLAQVRSVELGDDFLLYTLSVPRPLADGPGGAYTHLGVFGDLTAALAGRAAPRLLVSGKDSVSAPAARPGTRTISVLRSEGGRRQLFALPVDGGEARRIADTPSITAYWWRPDGRAFAFTSPDPKPASRQAAEKLGFHQTVVDEDFQHLSLWLWEQGDDATEDRVRKLTEGRTVFDVAWTPDGNRLALALAPRNLVDDSYMFKRLWLLDLAGGTLRPLTDNPGKLGALAWSPDGSRLAYVSAADRRDPHDGMLYVVHADSGAVRSLTEGLIGMVGGIHWLGADRVLCLLHRGVHSELATIGLDDGEISTLYSGAEALAGFSAYGARIALTAATERHPNEAFLGQIADGSPPRLEPRRLTDSNPWLAGVALGRQEVVVIAARDGLPIEGILMLPVGWREGQRYPLVVVVHGGPEAHFSDGWLTSYGNWGQCLAARGYCVWFPNYRASTGYGVEFAKLDHGDPMGGEFTDHLDAVDHFVQRGLVDPDRVGIGGGSYGGYTAAWAATRHSHRFAAAVSFVPFVDIRTKWMTSDIPWEFYLVHYQERWPWQQPGLLADRSPLTWAEHCRTPLLLLGGTADPRVHPSQPFMLYRAVKFATDTPVRYVQYPGEGHGNRSNVYQYDYLLRTLQWFDHYLKGAGDRRQKAPPPFDLHYAGLPAPQPAGAALDVTPLKSPPR